MKLNILKRAGMLAASTAVCCGVVFGGLAMNGLRYVRPTAENWTLQRIYSLLLGLNGKDNARDTG